MPVAIVLIWWVGGSSPLWAQAVRSALWPLWAYKHICSYHCCCLLTAFMLMTSKCSWITSLTTFQWLHPSVLVLILAVQSLASCLQNKAFTLGCDCICVYINVCVGIYVYIYVGCQLLKAIMHFSAFSFFPAFSLSLFYCVPFYLYHWF